MMKLGKLSVFGMLLVGSLLLAGCTTAALVHTTQPKYSFKRQLVAEDKIIGFTRTTTESDGIPKDSLVMVGQQYLFVVTSESGQRFYQALTHSLKNTNLNASDLDLRAHSRWDGDETWSYRKDGTLRILTDSKTGGFQLSLELNYDPKSAYVDDGMVKKFEKDGWKINWSNDREYYMVDCPMAVNAWKCVKLPQKPVMPIPSIS